MSSLHLAIHSYHFITPCSIKNYHLRSFQIWCCAGLNGHVADRSRAKLDHVGDACPSPQWVDQFALQSPPPRALLLGSDVVFGGSILTYRFMLQIML